MDVTNINNRCEILEGLGFIVEHLDIVVKVPVGSGKWITMDFSRIREEGFVEYALFKASQISFNNGRNSLKEDLKTLLDKEYVKEDRQ